MRQGERLAGRVALVTGATRGIGRGCALCLAEEGADIAINDRNPSDEALEVIREIEALGRRAEVVPGDIGRVEEVDALVAATLSHFGRIDILISNVAYQARMPFLEIPLDEVRRILDVGLLGAFRLAQLTAQHMVERGEGGKIVFISSIHAQIPFANSSGYNTIKAGINHLSCSLANELAQHRINVNTIEPGWIDTPGERQWTSDAQFQALAPKLPWRRLGTPHDIGQAAVFLASDNADYITGAILKVDGGYTASVTLNLG